MIKRDIAKDNETCPLCDRIIPMHSTILRKIETGKILCILCLVEIAEIAGSERK